MRDGFTRKVETPERDLSFEDFAARYRASVVVVSGEAAGSEWEVAESTTTIGRGSGCDWTIEDDTMSKEHAALEYTSGELRLRDLGSMNGVVVNGTETKAMELANGDRFKLGNHEFQFLLQQREKAPRTWVLPDADA